MWPWGCNSPRSAGGIPPSSSFVWMEESFFFFAACRLKEKKAKCLASVNTAASLLSTNLGSYVYSFTTSLELLPYCVECTEGPCPGSSLTTGSLPIKMLLRRCLPFSGESAVSLQKLDTPVLTYSSELSQVHPC